MHSHCLIRYYTLSVYCFFMHIIIDYHTNLTHQHSHLPRLSPQSSSLHPNCSNLLREKWGQRLISETIVTTPVFQSTVSPLIL